jgi:putative membrane protein
MSQNTGNTQLVTVLLVVVGVLVLFPMLFMGVGMMGFGTMMGGMWGGGMWGDGTMSGWSFAISILFQLLVLAILVGGGYLVYRAATGGDDGTDPAIEELRSAYARGDLTDEEYEQRREALERDTE